MLRSVPLGELVRDEVDSFDVVGVDVQAGRVAVSGYWPATLRSCPMPPMKPEIVGLCLQVTGNKPEGAVRFILALDEAERVAACLLEAVAIQRRRSGSQAPISSGSPSVDVSTVVGQ